MTQYPKRPSPSSRRDLTVIGVPTACLVGCVVVATLLFPACQFSAKTGKGAAAIIGRGIVNDPKNKSLRFDLIKFGLAEFCRELLERGAPLRLTDGQPVIGRYFGESCDAKSIDTVDKNSIVLQFGGSGYAWTAGTGRLGFSAAGLLELSPDFRLHEQAMYVYFRPIQVDTSSFRLLMTERPLAETAAQVVGLNEEELGKAIIDAQLGRGFTAIRHDADGHTEFALGLVEPGDTPFLPYQVLSSPLATKANGRTELLFGQQDFIGKIRVESNETLALTLRVEGAKGVDFALLSQRSASPYLRRYLSNPGTNPLPVVPTFESVATDQAQTRAEVLVPAGSYYLVLDHSRAWGKTTLAEGALPARVDYLIQLGRTRGK